MKLKPKYLHLYFFSVFVFSCMTLSAVTVRLSGFVRDAQTGEVLIGANIWAPTQNTGTTTDNRGYFSLKTQMPCTLTFSYVGFVNCKIVLNAVVDTIISVTMQPEVNLKEVTVTTTYRRKHELTRLSAKELLLVPAIGGKPDVIKALQLLPGVQTQSEGMSLMMVRGGDPGQNQYLLDNVPLIYVNHLGGLMSVFNPDMINSVDFYKGNFPAQHGGKLSSIVDITQREGDISKHQGSFSLGVTDAAFSFEGPLANKKMSYIITARKTLVDALLAAASTISTGNDAVISYGFHDVNAKLSWKPDMRNSLSLNLYQGDDYLNYWTKPWRMTNNEKSHINQQWGNWLVSGRWNRVVGTKLFSENMLSFSRYRNRSGMEFSYRENNKNNMIKALNMASVNDFSLRSIWKYALSGNWNLDFGAHAGYLLYQPDYNYLSTSSTPQIGNVYRSIESALFIDNRIRLSEKLIFQPSLRFSAFSNNGEFFPEWEPRISLSCQINENQSINGNYMRVSQSSHLIFTQAELLKREVWLPATQIMPPSISNQASLSWNGSFDNGRFSAESSLYYKKMNHLVSLKEGYENMLDITGIDNKVEINGTGIAYGTEFMLKKNTGKWTGSASYAWSYADRVFANINDGKSYEFDYNRPHSIALNVNCNLNNNWTMSAVWVFQSGTPYTPALNKYYSLDPETGESSLFILYGEKNSARMQNYHRLDLSFNHTVDTKHGNKAVWTYSLYNAYNRINPFGYYYDNDNELDNLTRYDRPLKLYKMGLFSIIPSISYKLYFDYTKKPKAPSAKKKYNWLYF